jgi:choline dehydrogenase-like flavoprotein
MPLADFLSPETKESLTAFLTKHLLPGSEPKFKAEKLHYDYIGRNIESGGSSATMFMIPVQTHTQRLRTSGIVNITEPEIYVSFLTQVAHPFSRGNIHVKTSDPGDHPTITPKYLSHSLDAEIMARHIMHMEQLATTAPLSDFSSPTAAACPTVTTVKLYKPHSKYAVPPRRCIISAAYAR